jgi:hypothetical protein
LDNTDAQVFWLFNCTQKWYGDDRFFLAAGHGHTLWPASCLACRKLSGTSINFKVWTFSRYRRLRRDGMTCRPEASQSSRAAQPGSCPRTFFSPARNLMGTDKYRS